MSQEKAAEPKSGTAVKVLISILVGPLAFFIVQSINFPGLNPAAHFALSSFAWVLAWWIAQPIPWAATGLLPLVLFPLGGAMDFKTTMALYGQPVLTFLLGVMLFGHAFQKHGLAQRMAITLLSIRGVATSGQRLLVAVMIVSAVVSAFIDDAASVAIMIPIALAIAKFAGDSYSNTLGEKISTPKMTTAMCLGVLYGATAGGMATPAGAPFNPLTISLLEQFTDYRISFVQWTTTGVFLAVGSLIVYFLGLKFMSPPEVKSISGAAEYFTSEKKKLGPMSRGEINVLIVFIIMVVLWFLPAFVKIKFLDIWYVPPLAAILLFLLPTDTSKGETTLNAKDFQSGVLWNILFLVVSGTAIAAGLTKLGMTEWLEGVITGGMTAGLLPWFAGIMTPLLSHATSGTATTALVSSIMFPIADNLGYNPTILARIIAGTALAVSLPWAGAAAGTCFSSGAITFGNMFKIGIVVTIFTMLVVVVLSMLLVPVLGAFSVV
ncbi:MAG: SLC13 family permease [Desulfotomaculaceae bacterium]|nr:SLC13 family permease [Desulfotomaculaceae bacterium]